MRPKSYKGLKKLFQEKSFMEAVKIEGNPLPGKIQVDFDGELLVGQSILLNGKNNNIPVPTILLTQRFTDQNRFQKDLRNLRPNQDRKFCGHPTRTVDPCF